MKFLKILLFLGLVNCGGTNLDDSLSLNSTTGGAQRGVDLTVNLTSQADFNTATLSNLSSSAGGDLEFNQTVVGETGRLTINNDIDNIAADVLTFRNTYTDPIVLAYIPTRNGGDSIDVRVDNITSTGCDIFIEDPLANGTPAETVVYMVLETGRHTFTSGLIIEAGTHTTGNTHISPAAFAGDLVVFSAAFAAAPIVLHTLNTYNNGDFQASVCHATSTANFNIQQEAAQTGVAAAAEDIGWAAFNTGAGSLGSISYDIGSISNAANDGVDDAAQTINYAGFAVAPDIIVKGNSGGGADGYWTRGAGTWNSTTHTSFAEEDTIGDAERNHADETFAYAAFTPDSDLTQYSTSGTATFATLNLASVKEIATTSFNWTETTPAGTTITLETNVSLDGGATWLGWTAVANGGSISGLTQGTNVENAQLKYRATFSTTDDQLSPSIQSILVQITTADD